MHDLILVCGESYFIFFLFSSTKSVYNEFFWKKPLFVISLIYGCTLRKSVCPEINFQHAQAMESDSWDTLPGNTSWTSKSNKLHET